MQKQAKQKQAKKQNIQTGLLMGQNTNIFSQLSATFLQNKSSATQDQQTFVKNTQIIQYHDPNINRIIALLRKKAQATKIKAVLQLHEQINKMNADQVQQFISTFVQLYQQIILNQPSKQIVDQFINISVDLITNHKKIVIKQISNFYPSLLISHKIQKITSLLFNGSQDELNWKLIFLLLKKQTKRKFIILTKIILDCEKKEKLTSPHYQRNCSSLIKLVKELIFIFNKLEKRKQIEKQFRDFIVQLQQSFGEECIEEYFKIGGKAKAAILQFYIIIVYLGSTQPQWNIKWQSYAKQIGLNISDKDPIVQQTLWKGNIRLWVQSLIKLDKLQQKQQHELINVQTYFPKSEDQIINVLKIGGFNLYKQLPKFCQIYPSSTFYPSDSHKSIVNKFNFLKKLMTSILQQQNENQTKAQCYVLLAQLFINRVRSIKLPVQQKKAKQIETLSTKFQKQIINNLQQRYYTDPPQSKNAFTYYIPVNYVNLLNKIKPLFDFKFNNIHSYKLYQGLQINEYTQKIFDQIYKNSKQSQSLILKYLQTFPKRQFDINMTQQNKQHQNASKIFLILNNEDNENWFKEQWDQNKKLIVYDPRILIKDLQQNQQKQQNSLYFRPSNRNINCIYTRSSLDLLRYQYFQKVLLNNDGSNNIKYYLPFINDIIIPRNINYLIRIIDLFNIKVQQIRKGQWNVGAQQVIIIRVLSKFISQSLHNYQAFVSQNIQKCSIFISGILLFVRALWNYKMETIAQQILQSANNLIVIPQIHHLLLSSCKEITGIIIQFLLKGSIESKETIRKNRLKKNIELYNKILWQYLPKSKQQYEIDLALHMLKQQKYWVNAIDRVQAWAICQCVLQLLNQSTLSLISKQYLKNNYSLKSLTIFLSIQNILPLQNQYTIKKIFNKLKLSFYKQIKNQWKQNQQSILQKLLKLILQSNNLELTQGIKGIINYQVSEQESQLSYNLLCKNIIIAPLQNYIYNNLNIYRSLIYSSVLSSISLSKIQGIQEICANLVIKMKNLKDQQYLQILSIVCVFWDKGIGIAQIINQNSKLIKQSLQTSLSILSTPSQSKLINNFKFYVNFNLMNVAVAQCGWDIIKQISSFQQYFWKNIQIGSQLHALALGAKLKFATRWILSAQGNSLLKLITQLPQKVLDVLSFYRIVLIRLQNDDEQLPYHQNIVGMFIESSQFLIRSISFVNNTHIPKQSTLLELVQSPFPALKRASFLLLKRIYDGQMTQRTLPQIFTSNALILLKCQNIDNQFCSLAECYFFLWQLLLLRKQTTQRLSQNEEQPSISLQQYIQGSSWGQIFLKNFFYVLQKLDYNLNQDDLLSCVNKSLRIDFQRLFLQQVLEKINIQQSLFRVSLKTFYNFVSNYPLFLRDFVDKHKKNRPICQRLLRQVVSQAIFEDQIAKIQLKQPMWKAAGNFEIFVTQKNREIYAQYTHDVIRIGLRLLMKPTYPLVPVSIQFGQKLKVQDGSRWGLMLQTQLHSRNNTIINGILLWKQNIQKKLSGVQQCSICFDIVNSNGQLPKKGCKTCKKKFHGNCIMKWFTTSNKSECPLCKSQFL